MYSRFGFALAMSLILSEAIAQTCVPEVPVLCGDKTTQEWLDYNKQLRCVPLNPGETVEKCEPLFFHETLRCVLDVQVRDRYGSLMSRGLSEWLTCPLKDGVPTHTYNRVTQTCVKSCPAAPDIQPTGPLTCGIDGAEPFTLQGGGKFGNPIVPATGEKIQQERDIGFSGPHSFQLSRLYRSSRAGLDAKGVQFSGISYPTDDTGESPNNTAASIALHPDAEIPPMGVGWSVNFTARFRINPSVYDKGDSIHRGWVFINLPNGGFRSFKPSASGLWTDSNPQRSDRLRLSVNTEGAAPLHEFIYQPMDTDDQYVFHLPDGAAPDPVKGHTGFLKEIRHANGWRIRFEVEAVGSSSSQRTTHNQHNKPFRPKNGGEPLSQWPDKSNFQVQSVRANG